MTNQHCRAFAIIVSTFIATTSSQNMSLNEQQSALACGNVSASCSRFTNQLYKSISAATADNILTSPLSIHLILSLLSNGASGSTLNELISVLYHDDMFSLIGEFKDLMSHLNGIKNIDLSMANAAYVQDGFELMTDFSMLYTIVFESEITRLDFKHNVHAAETINTWIQQTTNNKISDIVTSDDFDEDTKLVLVNAIYFKSKWLQPFNEQLTQKRKFYISKTDTSLVSTMFRKSTYDHGEIPEWHIRFIEIPYLNQDITMIILLPNEDAELQTLEKNFNWETLDKTPRSNDEIELYLPRFKFEITMDLEDILRKIGLNSMFEDNANFQNLSSTPLKVNKVLQKVFIQVDEEGSEAAAATVVQLRLRRMINILEEFKVDRPFMFAIKHKPSKLPLFLGSVRKIEDYHERDEL